MVCCRSYSRMKSNMEIIYFSPAISQRTLVGFLQPWASKIRPGKGFFRSLAPKSKHTLFEHVPHLSMNHPSIHLSMNHPSISFSPFLLSTSSFIPSHPPSKSWQDLTCQVTLKVTSPCWHEKNVVFIILTMHRNPEN